MPSILLSDNGVSSGSAGLKSTAASDGVLVLQTTTSGGTATNAIYVDTSQRVGIKDATIGSNALSVRAISNTYTGGALALQDAAGTSKMYLTSVGSQFYVGDNALNDCVIINQYGVGLGANAPTSGLGVRFPATQSASSDANTLDDYEEGTWTTTTGALTNCSTLTLGQARYTKVGRLVTIDGFFDVIVTSANTLTYFSFTLPFPLISTTAGGCGAAIMNNEFAVGGVYRASGVTDAVYMLFKASIGFGSGANKFMFTYTYQTT